MHGLEAEYWGKIDFVYLDIDNPANQSVMHRYRFTAQPLFLLIKPDGTLIQRWYGYTSATDFRSALDQYLATAGNTK